MILVPIVAIVREDEIRRKLLLQLLEAILHFPAPRRQEPVAELVDEDRLVFHAGQQGVGALERLALARRLAAEDDPVEGHLPRLPDQLGDRAAAADLDVVGMRAHAQDAPNPAPELVDPDGRHAWAGARRRPRGGHQRAGPSAGEGRQTSQGVRPWDCSSSRWRLSLKVSMEAQNPSYL